MGTPLFVVKNGLHLFVTRDILARYEVFRWDNYNGKTSDKILSVTYSTVSWINKWYIGIYWPYNRQKQHLIITNPHMEWQEGYGMVFYGMQLIDIVFGRF